MKILLTLIIVLSLGIPNLSAQVDEDSEKTFLKYSTWTVLQAIPSPVWYSDNNTGIKFGLRWHVTPINISFNANKLISPVQFFMINPVRRFSGSAEVFVQPEYMTGGFDYADKKKFSYAVGTRFIIPVNELGEHLAFSLGGKYNIVKNNAGQSDNYYGVEAGMYVMYGMIGLQANYNFKSDVKYNFGIYLKYF